VIFLYVLIALAGAGLAYQMIGSRRDARRFQPLGRVIRTSGGRVHLQEEGSGRPAAILEAGIAASSLSWALVQPRVARFTRVVSYDRAGLGWSSACAAPRTVERMISELGATLHAAGIAPPYILCGHSFGGLLMRAYAALRPEQVAGLLLVDPVSLEYWASCSPRDWQRLRFGAKLSRRGVVLAHLGIVRFALALLASGSRLAPRIIARAAARRAAGHLANLVGQVQKLPPALWPMVRSHWSDPKCFGAMARYLESLPENARAALQLRLPAGLPLIILSASNATAEELAERDAWVRQSGRGRHTVLEDTGHWLPLERPEAVSSAIAELTHIARGGPAQRAPGEPVSAALDDGSQQRADQQRAHMQQREDDSAGAGYKSE
jgi:pimeloyl-ACP methyl ester carboxylesterase